MKKSKFLHDASHELKTPITVIMSYSHLLKRGANTPRGCRRILPSDT
ncbi:histidine kinase dimerization/phospho-acceptor domain-containing protein [Bacillus sp. SL00103]